MFFYLISKLIVTNGNKLKIFVMGIIFYILAHAYLFSKYSDSNNLIAKYRNYLYYLFGVDCALTFLFAAKKTDSIEDDCEDESYNRSDKKKQIENNNKKNNNEENEEDENDANDEIDENVDPRYNQININNINSSKTREEIIRMMTELRKSQGDQQKNTEYHDDHMEEEEEQYDDNENQVNNTQDECSKSEYLNNASITIYKSKNSKDAASVASIPLYVSKNN